MSKSRLQYFNTTCLRCGCCHPRMVKVGAMVFCCNCQESVFGKTDDIDDKVYEIWLDIWKKRIENE